MTDRLRAFWRELVNKDRMAKAVKTEDVITAPAAIEAALADSVPAVAEPEPPPAPEPVAEPDPPAPVGNVVLESAAERRLVTVEWPRRRLQHVDGLTWAHVGEDADGRWIYRPE